MFLNSYYKFVIISYIFKTHIQNSDKNMFLTENIYFTFTKFSFKFQRLPAYTLKHDQLFQINNYWAKGADVVVLILLRIKSPPKKIHPEPVVSMLYWRKFVANKNSFKTPDDNNQKRRSVKKIDQQHSLVLQRLRNSSCCRRTSLGWRQRCLGINYKLSDVQV